MEFTIHSPNELPDIARQVLNKFPHEKIFAFYGNMGAGKTTFISELCKKLGVKDRTGSPTYAIVNEYHTNDGKKIYHFDFYRLKTAGEALDIGCEEYFSSGNYCFIEWPEKIGDLLPLNCLKINIKQDEATRKIIISG